MVGVTGALIGASIIGAGSSIISGNKAAKAATQGADTAAQASLTASREANALQKEIFDTTRADYAPWRATGEKALGKLESMYLGGQPDYSPMSTSEFEASPGYQYRIGEAMKAIERSAAASGLLRSGATMKAINRDVQGIAADDYWRATQYRDSRKDEYGNRLAALAGIGQGATGATAAAGENYASSAGRNIMTAGNTAATAAAAAGNARASAYQNTGSAINGGIQNLAGMYLYNKGWGG